MNGKILEDLITTKMPFGKYKGTPVYRLPAFYVAWFAREGFPQGKLGMLLSTMHEIRDNGLEYLLEPLIRNLKR